ncbi:MAG: DUF2188 domain-containing protein [Proteobacteria bacterium]|nr:DUF2188 domain-containing protein [Pseudomonadota bacterium]
MPENHRYVTTHAQGWAVQKPHAVRVSSIHATQQEAQRRAKQIVAHLGGGEVRIQGRNGRWRETDTVLNGHGPQRT